MADTPELKYRTPKYIIVLLLIIIGLVVFGMVAASIT